MRNTEPDFFDWKCENLNTITAAEFT